MKKLIILLFIILALLIGTVPTFAASNTPESSITKILSADTFVIRDVLQSGDALFISPYSISTTTWSGYTGNDIIVQLINSQGKVVINSALKHLGAGVVTFYLDPVEFASSFTWPEDAKIYYVTNPQSFLNSANSDDLGLLRASSVGTGLTQQWISVTSVQAAHDYLDKRLVQLMSDLGNQQGNSLLYLTGGSINAEGSLLLTDSFPQFSIIAPNAGIIGGQVLNQALNSSSSTLLATNLSGETNVAKTYIFSLASSLGIPGNILAILISVIIFIPGALVLKRYTGEMTYSYIPIAIGIIFFTSLGVVSFSFVTILAMFFIAIIGMWIWSKVPSA